MGLMFPASGAHPHDHPQVRMPPHGLGEPAKQREAIGRPSRHLRLGRKNELAVLGAALGLLRVSLARLEWKRREVEGHVNTHTCDEI